MTSNQPTLASYAARMRTLVEEDLRVAADLRELAKEMREHGYQAVVLKALVKALVKYDEGDEKPLRRLQDRAAETAMYAAALGVPVEGDDETKRFVVNHSHDGTAFDPETGKIIETESRAKPEASAPKQDLPSGKDPGRHSGSRASGGAGTAAPDSMRGRAVVAHLAHNQEVAGSTPAPATSSEAGTDEPDPVSVERREGLVPPEATPTPSSPGERETAAPDPYADLPDIPPEFRRTA